MKHAPALVLIDTGSFRVLRYVGNRLTHIAEASRLDRKLIEQFRIKPPPEFEVPESPEAA